MRIPLAFTTLGCPDWDIDTIVRRAVEYGFAGVDFRGYLADVDLRKSPAFTKHLAGTAARLRDAGLQVPCLSSGARMFDASPDARHASLDEMRAYAELCTALQARYLRIFGGSLGGTPREQAIAISADMLRAAAQIAGAAGIVIVVETHDDWVASPLLRRVFETAGWPAGVGILWDVHHPFRLAHESPAATYAAIGPHTRYTHWKDSRPSADGQQHALCPIGEGDLPLYEFFRLLHGGGYDGWYVFEWEQRWHRNLPAPEIAFPGFVRHMRAFERRTSGA